MSNFFNRAKGDMKYLFNPPSHLNEKGRKRRKRAILTIIGLILVAVQLVALILFHVNLIILNILPVKYFTMLLIVLSLILIYDFLSQFTRSHILGKILAVLMSAIMIFGYIVAGQLNSAFQNISGTTTQTDVVDIIVLSDSSAQSLKDVLNGSFGFNSGVDETLVNKALDLIEKEHNKTVKTKSYSSWDDLIDNLYTGTNINVMMVSDAMRVSLAEQFEDFNTKTKIIDTISITSEVKIDVSNKNVSNESFIVYISGNDSYGSVQDNCRSDVNILAVVNPLTRQILLVSTPRDYYITISNAAGKTGLDKLTHAGNAGTKYSIKALEDLYRIKVDYYCKVNFTGCVKIIDSLGGITINSSVAFTNGTDAAPIRYKFVVGPNQCDGAKALAFVRERHAFGQGDLQRGRNQQAAIEAIINKATSPAILANYASLLDAATKMVITNMPTATITDLIRAQLNDSTPWKIQSYSAAAQTTGKRNCQVYNLANADVVIPDFASVNDAIKLINKTYNGESYDISQYTTAAPKPAEEIPTTKPAETTPTENETSSPTESHTPEHTTESSSANSTTKPTPGATKPTTPTTPTASTASTTSTTSATEATKPTTRPNSTTGTTASSGSRSR